MLRTASPLFRDPPPRQRLVPLRHLRPREPRQ
jgi:hypothetical protein